MRTLLKLEKTENCIVFQTVSKNGASFRYKYRSNRFYVTKPALRGLLDKYKSKGYAQIIEKDIYSFISIGISKKEVYIEFTWLDSNGHQLKGEKESIELMGANMENFLAFINDDRDEIQLLNSVDNSVPKIEVREGDSIKGILGNPILKRKFIKAIMRFQNYQDCDKVTVCDDGYMDYSFSWARSKQGKYITNGGLIFHKDYKSPQDLSKGYFGIHT